MAKLQNVNMQVIIVGLVLVIFGMAGPVSAQPPTITCPAPLELTLDDIGQVCIEIPITGWDSVYTSAGSYDSASAMLCFDVSMPVAGSVTVIAANVDGEDTCEVAYSFPGVTTKAGTIDGEHWTADTGVYCVVGDLHIGELVIDPGVDILFFGNYELNVNGSLTAEGLDQDSIRFVNGKDSVTWNRIYLNEGSAASSFRYCIFEGSQNRAIYVYNTQIIIANSTFSNNKGGGIYSNRPLRLYDCIFYNNHINTSSNTRGGGAYVNADAGFYNCHFINNGLSSIARYVDRSSYGGGLYISGNAIICNCMFEENSTYAKATGLNNPYDHRYAYSRGGGAYIAGDAEIVNCIVTKNSSIASSSGGHGHPIRGGSGIYIASGTVAVNNCTFVLNDYEGLRRDGGQVSVLNSIFWENGSAQLRGLLTSQFCCVQNADTSDSNPDSMLNSNPQFYNNDSLVLLSTSPCIDAGHPSVMYHDPADPDSPDMALWPARGTLRNDIGAYGGPGAAGWLGLPVIVPVPPIDTVMCGLQEICIDLDIIDADNVTASIGNWAANQLCFTPDSSGQYLIEVTATNDSGSISSTVDITVEVDVPMLIEPEKLLFAMTDTDTVLPDPQKLLISSTCGDSVLDWSLVIPPAADWLEADKYSGSNPDTVAVSVVDETLTPGIYTAQLEFIDNTGIEDPVYINVTLFVESGVEVGDDKTEAGEPFAVPIHFFTEVELSDFTLPIKLNTIQPGEIKIDSVVTNPALSDTLIFNEDSTVIVYRPLQPPPNPDSIYTLGYVYGTSLPTAQSEVAIIDTTTVDIGGTVYSYRFIEQTGDTTVPYYNKGIITVGQVKRLTIGEVHCPQAGAVGVPIIAEGLADLGSGDLNISYNADIAVPSGALITSDYVGSDLLAINNDVENSVIRFAWADPAHPLSLANGDTLVTLWFMGVGDIGQRTSLSWVDDNMLGNSQSQQIYDVELYDGGITVDSSAEFSIGGQIQYYTLDHYLEGAPVMMSSGETSWWDTTGSGGWCLYSDVSAGNYTVRPVWNWNAPGLDILDASDIMLNLADMKTFSCYQEIAADINGTNSVTITDVIEALRYIVELDTLLPVNWRFVAHDYFFGENCFTYPDSMSVTVNNASVLDADFIGIRTGDVNGSFSSERNGSRKLLDNPGGEVLVTVENPRQNMKGLITVPLSIECDKAVTGIELHLAVDSRIIGEVRVKSDHFEALLANKTDGMLHIAGVGSGNIETESDRSIVIEVQYPVENRDDYTIAFNLESGLAAVDDGYAYPVKLESAMTEEGANGLPDWYELGQNRPNPFNPTTNISFALPNPSQVRIEVLNILGQRVKVLLEDNLEAGAHTVVWDGCDANGSRVASGIYLYRMEAEGFHQTKKMVLVK